MKPRYRHVTVLCPPKAVTGGPEALHQLVHAIRTLGGDASICYRGAPDGLADVPEPYRHYGTPVISRPIGGQGTALLSPEIWPDALRDTPCESRLLWWLSVDNFAGTAGPRTRRLLDVADRMPRRVASVHDRHVRRASMRLARRWPKLRLGEDWVHLTQSYYAHDYVARRVGASPHMLTDYLAPAHHGVSDDAGAGETGHDASTLRDRIVRRPQVAYNPAKGQELTRRIREACPDVSFVPIAGMTAAGVARLLESSAAYIDFGEHPGRDRLPREAAMHGAVVIVGTRGAAAYPDDYPLPEQYRVPVTPLDVGSVQRLLLDVLARHAVHACAQQAYRHWVQEHRERFMLEVAGVFFA